MDAGADTTAAVRVTTKGVTSTFTPLAHAGYFLGARRVGGKDALESQVHSLEAIRRLLMRVEAVHAVS